MKKPELVALAEQHGLKKTGTKDDLMQRIVEALPPAPATFDLPDDETILKVVEGLNGIKLAQRTPERVAHRRSDLIRKRTVFEAHSPFIEVNEDGQREIEFTLRCESGTYVKETVHGDSGRTQPSVAALIKAKCNVVWLDVGDIHADRAATPPRCTSSRCLYGEGGSATCSEEALALTWSGGGEENEALKGSASWHPQHLATTKERTQSP